MFQNSKKYRLLLFVFLLLLLNIFLFRLDFQSSNKGLTFVMLDVGQGEALFIESPTGTQIMFDGGGAKSVLGPLARAMSPFDKSIDALVITNPDADHIGGFVDILKNYTVGGVFEPGTINDSKLYQNVKDQIKNKKIPNILARRGMRLHLGGGAFIDILFPDRDVYTWAPNDGSIVARLVYGNTSLMLTGDSTTMTEKIILSKSSKTGLSSTVLKVGHHGSRTSTGAAFIKAVSPSYTLISDGKNNTYGHPHRETLDVLTEFGAKIFRTDILGTIVMRSDGQNVKFSFHK